MTKEEIRTKVFDMPYRDIIDWITDLEEVKANYYKLMDAAMELLGLTKDLEEKKDDCN